MWVAQLLAQAKPRFGQILEPTLWLIGGLLLSALVIWLIQRYYHTQTGRSRASEHSDLAHFRRLHDRGEMSDEEYNKVHAKLSSKIQKNELSKEVGEGPTISEEKADHHSDTNKNGSES